MRLVVGALLALAVGACADLFGNLPDGEQIDGTLITSGGGSQTVVFEMEDGCKRAVTVYSLGMCMTGAGA